MQLASSFRQDFGNSRVQCSAVRTAVLTALYGGFSLRRFLGHKPHFCILGAGLDEGECLSQLRRAVTMCYRRQTLPSRCSRRRRGVTFQIVCSVFGVRRD